MINQHRFYGESAPLGSMEEAMKNQSIRGCFNSAQALADYAHLLLHIKQKLSSPNSPIFAVGGSYGGSNYIFTPPLHLLIHLQNY